MIYNILKEIAEESSTNSKMNILKNHDNKEYTKLLKQVLYLGMSKRIKFYIKQLPDIIDFQSNKIDLEYAIDKLSEVYNRNITGHDALDFVSSLLSRLTDEEADVLSRIIKKDLKIGMGRTNVNKVFPNLLEKTPYMGAKSFSESLARKITNTGRAWSQCKMDGRYNNSIIRSGDVELESRNGEPGYLDNAAFVEELKKSPIDCVLNGEFTVDGVESRYIANGIIASLISIGKKQAEGKPIDKELIKFESKHGSYELALSNVRYTVWDIITPDEYYGKISNLKYCDRWKKLEEFLEMIDAKQVSIVESKLVKTYEEALEHFREMLSNGLEGTILKDSYGKWKDGKPSYQCKMKLDMELDLKITGFNYGKVGTKNENVISSLNTESSDGLLKTSPQGITEDMMKYITENQNTLIGSIAVVKCCGLSKNNLGEWSTLHPVLQSIREDKDEADSLKDCQTIEQMITGLNYSN